MRKKRSEPPTIGNVLRLFGQKLRDFKGESLKSYRKAFSSFQIFLISNYHADQILDESIIQNWIIDNIRNGLTLKTVSFYLDKISSLYSGVIRHLTGGREISFKEIKRKLKNMPASTYQPSISQKIYQKLSRQVAENKNSNILSAIKAGPDNWESGLTESLSFIWATLALKAGLQPDTVKGILTEVPSELNFLTISSAKETEKEEKERAKNIVWESLHREEQLWFAMRLRPKVKFESLMERFSLLPGDTKVPELFYPCEEIARRIGRKVVWEGRPVIRDVVFFKYHRKQIYPLFSKIYDLAWCYRNPGTGAESYASIPTKAMEDFKKSLGILNQDFEVAPSGEMKLKAGDVVVIVNGDYAEQRARITKPGGEDADGNKVFRVSLLDSNGHWDIGIDARLLKKI